MALTLADIVAVNFEQVRQQRADLEQLYGQNVEFRNGFIFKSQVKVLTRTKDQDLWMDEGL